MAINYQKLQYWHTSYIRRHFGWAFIWVLVLLSGGALASMWVNFPIPVPRPCLFLGLILAWALAVASGATLCLWHSLNFRYLAWRTSVVVGRLWRWLTHGWQAFFLFYVAVAILMELLTSFGGENLAIPPLQAMQGLHPHKLFASFRWLEVLVTALLLAMFYQMYRGSRRIVILEFQNHTGDAKLKEVIEGLSVRMQHQLATIIGYYRAIDDALPEFKGEFIEADISVKDAGEALKGVITSESKISLGPLTIPVGSIMTMLALLWQAPRLACSVHMDDGKLLFVASLSGSGRKGSWRAKVEAWSENSLHPDPLPELIEQLAYRIFADLALVGSNRWRAVRWYIKGLCAYRDATAGRRNSKYLLLQAERALMQALEEDSTFALCHYDLGVVYRKLDKLDASEAAFRKAVANAPDFLEAYYALACIYDKKEMYGDSIWWCEQMLRLRSDEPRAYNLKGLVLRKLKEKQLGIKRLVVGEHSEVWEEIIPVRDIAAAIAWKQICQNALSHDHKQGAVFDVVSSTRNAAVAYGMKKSYRHSQKLLGQAIRLCPTDSQLYFELGKVLYDSNDLPEAKAAFECVFEDALPGSQDRMMLWSYLVQARLMKNANRLPLEGQEAVRHILDIAAETEGDTRKYILVETESLRKKLEETGYMADSCALDQSVKFLDWLIKADASALQAKLNTHSHGNSDWCRAQLMLKIANDYIEEGKSMDVASMHMEEAIAILQPEHLRQVRSQGLYGILASTYLFDGKPKKALLPAEKAVQLQPERAWERAVLGDVSQSLKDYERAETEYQKGLSLDPTRWELYQAIAAANWKRGVDLREGEQRRRALRGVIDYFNQALQLMDMSEAYHHNNAACIYYWLGQFHRELREHDAATFNLQRALSLDYKPIESLIALGWNNLEAEVYVEADRIFCKAIGDAWHCRQRHNNAKPLSHPANAEGENIPIGELLLQAHLGLAFSATLRMVATTFDAGRQEVLRQINRAEYFCHLPKLSQREKYIALCHVSRGLLSLKKNKSKEAIRELEQAVSIWPNEIVGPMAYYHLAEAYWVKAQEDKKRRLYWVKLADNAAQRAAEEDLRGLYTRKLERLGKFLAGITT